MTEAFRSRKAMFLAADSWASVPYQFSAKSSHELLLDIILQIPGLLERADQIKLLGPTEEYWSDAQQCTNGSYSSIARYNQAIEYLQDCDSVIQKLNHWLESLQESENGPLWWYSKVSDLRYSKSQSILGTQSDNQSSTIHFSGSRIPGLLINYWTGLLELCTAALEIGTSLHHISLQKIACGTLSFQHSSMSMDADIPSKLAMRICDTAVHLGSSLEGCTMAYIPVMLAEKYFMRLLSPDYQMQYNSNSGELHELERAQINLEYSREVLQTLQK